MVPSVTGKPDATSVTFPVISRACAASVAGAPTDIIPTTPNENHHIAGGHSEAILTALVGAHAKLTAHDTDGSFRDRQAGCYIRDLSCDLARLCCERRRRADRYHPDDTERESSHRRRAL